MELVELLIGCVFMTLVLIAGYLFGSRGRKPSKTSQKKNRQNAQQKTQKKTVVALPKSVTKKADPAKQKVEVKVQQNKKVEKSREIPQIDEVSQTATPQNVQQTHTNKKNMNQKNTNNKSSTQKVTENIKKTINQHPPQPIEDTPTNKGKQPAKLAKPSQPIQAPKIDIKNQNDKQKQNQAQPSQEHPTDNKKKPIANKKVQKATQPQTEIQTDKKKPIDNKNQKTTPTRSINTTSPTNAGTTQPVKAVKPTQSKSVQSQAANAKKKQKEISTPKGASSGKGKQNTNVAPQASSANQERVDKRDIERENTNEWVSVDSRSSELDSLKKKLSEFEKEATYLHGFIEGQEEKLKYYTTECSRLTDQKQKQKNDYGTEISKLEKQLDILNDGKKKSAKPVDVLSQKNYTTSALKIRQGNPRIIERLVESERLKREVDELNVGIDRLEKGLKQSIKRYLENQNVEIATSTSEADGDEDVPTQNNEQLLKELQEKTDLLKQEAKERKAKIAEYKKKARENKVDQPSTSQIDAALEKKIAVLQQELKEVSEEGKLKEEKLQTLQKVLETAREDLLSTTKAIESLSGPEKELAQTSLELSGNNA